MDLDFDQGFDLDFSCLDHEDFGLAKSFSKAPIALIAPEINREQASQVDPEKEFENEVLNATEIRADGFCFKLHPAEDQVQFQRDMKKLAPKMMDFAKGTTTLAFEF